MRRITNPDELFFPVTTQPVYTRPTDVRLATEIAISNRQAVVNVSTNEVLGVVGKDYRLVTNREACAYARQCAKAVFPNTIEDEWEIFSADAPQSGIYCHIDLRHSTGGLDFNYVMVGTREGVPDAYGPYMRVTNSYNGLRALKFSIGYYRKICANGLTSGEDIISFSFAHTRENIQTKIDFVVNHDRVQKMQRQFTDAFDTLRLYIINHQYGKELTKAALAIRMPQNAREHENPNFNAFQRDWFRLDGYIESLYTKYADKLGDNAYAVLQAATELASHPIENLCLRKDKHTLQRLAGEWLIDFKEQCAKDDFNIADYLARESHAHEALAKSTRVAEPSR